MTSSCEKNYKHFINYKDDDHRIKPLRIMLLRTSAYVKCCNGETKWMSFLLKMMSYQEHIIIFGINPAAVLKKNLIANPSTIKKNLKTKIRSYGNEATDFHDKELPDASSNCTCLAVI